MLQPMGSSTAFVQSQGSPEKPRLVRAAHEFEAQMMKELMKPMTASDPLTGDESGDDDNSTSGSNGAMGEYATEALGRALSEHGGLGIANTIVQKLSHPGHAHATTMVTARAHGNTV